MTQEEFYGASFHAMLQAQQQLLALVDRYPNANTTELKPLVYRCSRIKAPDSMMRKLEKRGLPQNGDAALTELFDAIGVRVVCAFAEDVYQMVGWLEARPELEVVREKDYIAYPKPNGYRSYHLQVRICGGPGQGLPAEIQVRTIATDFWATLEHQLKYKKNLPHEELIRSELKRCADEIASVDISMQTIRDIIMRTEQREKP